MPSLAATRSHVKPVTIALILGVMIFVFQHVNTAQIAETVMSAEPMSKTQHLAAVLNLA